MQPAHEKLRQARLRAGKSITQLSEEVDVSENELYDLEAYDDEIYMGSSLKELTKICSSCCVDVRSLFLDSCLEQRIEPAISFNVLRELVAKVLIEEKKSIDAFGDEVGWDLTQFLNDPTSAWEWNIDCLRDLSSALGIDWLEALPLRFELEAESRNS